MNTEHFNSEDDAIELVGFTAIFSFKTLGSIGFDLCVPRRPEARGRVILGHLQVHSPCTGAFATRVVAHFPGSRDLANLPQQERFQRCQAIVSKTFESLELKSEQLASYEASFIFPTDSFTIVHSPDFLYTMETTHQAEQSGGGNSAALRASP